MCLPVQVRTTEMHSLITLALSIIVFQKAIGKCLIKNGDLCDVMQCTDKSGRFYISRSHAEDGSTCFFRCANETFTTWKTCSDGIWSLSDSDGYHSQIRHGYGQLVRTKRGWFGSLFHTISCIGTLGLVCGHRHRDKEPPSVTCPPDIRKDSDDFQDYATVSWMEPMAIDDGHSVRPRRVGLAPGLQFSKGITTISYYVRDSSGNMASCSFNIHVTVPICPDLSDIRDGWYMCHTSFEMRKGTQCKFGCYEGHILRGERSIRCTAFGTWTGRQPTCERVTCDELIAPPGMTLTCTDGNNFRSKCTYRCGEGFDIRPGMTRVRVCTSSGQWRGNIPTCFDILPPVITNCIGAIYGYADRGRDTGRLIWNEPSVSDNFDKMIKLQQTAGPNNYMNNLKAGSYLVTYDATDRAGNKALQCQMKIVMKVLRCPKIYSLPLQTVTCEGGIKFGALCNFTCANGSVINGSSQASCEKDSNGQYVSWRWGSQQPFCEAKRLCEDGLEPPLDGAVACDYWLGGQFCQMLCRKGYDVPVGYRFPEMYVCGVDTGKWTPGSKLPNCARTTSSHQAIVGISMDYYFDGDCTDATVVNTIRQQFIQALNQSSYKDACIINEESCSPSNVEVKCGSQSGKRSTGVTIGFAIEITTKNAFGNHSSAKLNEKIKAWVVKSREGNDSLDIQLDNHTLIVQDVHSDGLQIVCKGQTIPSEASESCVECPPGTFYDEDKQECPLCPTGQYQPAAAQTDCIQCPVGKTTRHKGAKLRKECEVACSPGTYSISGLPPCSLCDVGSYTDRYGSTECSSCPGSRTTIHEGETSETSCADFDLVFSNENGSIVHPLNSNLSRDDSLIVSFWIKMQDDVELGSVLKVIYPGQQLDIALNQSSVNVVLEGIIFKTTSDFSINDTKWHTVVVNVNQSDVLLYVDSAVIGLQYYVHSQSAPSPSANHDPRVVIAEGEFVGSLSQLNIWSQQRDVRYIVRETSYCHSTTQGNILGWKQFETIDDDHVFLQIPSECDDHDDCTTDACNGGTCIDGLNTYSCECPIGLKGDHCEINIDDCADNVCENNSTCVDGIGSYKCLCDLNFKGEFCEIAIVDGEWSVWSNWTTCSTTCGEGTTSRVRLCNSPTPDNGGKDCQGDAIERDMCILDNCTACTNLTTPAHAVLDCLWDTSDDAINCSLSCEDGYDFDHAAKESYRCGQDTFHLWDFQTDDNPYGRLPDCTKKMDANKLEWKYMASYVDLVCDTETKVDIVERKIKKVVYEGTESLTCKRDGSCSLVDIEVTGCPKERVKRSESQSTAGFAADFNCDATKFTSDGCKDVVISVLNEMLAKISIYAFNTQVDGTEYTIMENSSMFGGRSYCRAGMVPVQHYCVPCSRGRFQHGDECEKCTEGTYQGQIGSTTCTHCPEGFTTEGRASQGIEDCFVVIEEPSHHVPAWVYGLPIGLCVGVAVLFIMAIILWRRKNRKGKQKRELKDLADFVCRIKGRPKHLPPTDEIFPVAEDSVA
ncbi:sushi, von Willebrand factor type A, EGF and pentraxin domain-containing protein 1-like [Argopecten irradians]|uniref:sushi, von Willebrand factor type A, EGF and pentraxin domain-containing protein 1-like n=1 Tax=Argopecten irradians TaxID=31199 RepID=UPI00371E16CD